MSELVFSEGARNKLARLSQEKTLIGLDFDGTLVGIENHPHEVKISAEVKKMLLKISMRRPVAIISGRAVSDVKRFVHTHEIRLIGNHGLEGFTGDSDLSYSRLVVKKWKKDLKVDVTQIKGAVLEDKKLSLSLHYRNTDDHRKSKQMLEKLISTLYPKPYVIGGKLVLNLLAQRKGHKGGALRRLMKEYRCSHAIFIGDDVTDESVFALASKKILTVRVGVSLTSKAKFHIKNQREVLKFLQMVYELLPK